MITTRTAGRDGGANNDGVSNDGAQADVPVERSHAVPYTEHDKLGPLGTTEPVLRDGVQLRAAMIQEFRASADAAQHAATSIIGGTTAAVHGSRKALRRARAVITMIAGELPKNERRAVTDALRNSRRALSTARDHAVAPETLAQLPLGPDERVTANKILANAADAMPPTLELEQRLRESAARAAAQAEALDAALPAELPWSTVVAGIRSVYAEARRARRGAKRSKRSFHTWRRRSKELVYQLEIVARHAGMHVGQIHAELEGVTETASPAVDLVMLREFVETYAQGIAAEAVEHLQTAIAAQLDGLMESARKAGRDAFRRKPSRFEKFVTKAVRRDLAPPKSPDGDTGDEDDSDAG